MLVLSRRLGESVVINDRLVLTVALIVEDHVELSLINVDGSFVGSFNAHANESIRLSDETHVIVVRIEGEKVRMGFEGPADARFHRGEFWNLPQ